MGKDIENILNFFSEPLTRNISEKYLKKYWLNEHKWYKYWKPLKDKIFCPESISLPDIIFNKDFELIALIGGVIFVQEDFEALRKCMIEAGDKWFVVIENEYMQPVIVSNGQRVIHPCLRFEFPSDIAWNELLNGGFISREIFETSYKEFFVFGNSGKWGKYVANEYWDRSVNSAGTPLDIIGFKPELTTVFKEQFKQLKEDQNDAIEWLPQEYKKLIKVENQY